MLLITALTVAASYMVYRNAVCLADEVLDLGLGLASESLLPWNISLPNERLLLPHEAVTLSELRSSRYGWEDYISEEAAGEGDWSQAIPEYKNAPPQNCNDPRLAGIARCNFNLPAGFGEALETLRGWVRSTRGVSIDQGFDSDDWDPAQICPGGAHWNIRGTGGWSDADGLIATILCCPCCDDSYGSPIFSWKCHVNPKFNTPYGAKVNDEQRPA